MLGISPSSTEYVDDSKHYDGHVTAENCQSVGSEIELVLCVE